MTRPTIIKIISITTLTGLLVLIGFQIQSSRTSDWRPLTSNQTSTQPDLLLLVNHENAIPINYQIHLSNFHGHRIATVLIDDLEELINTASRANIHLQITSAYRTQAEQKQLFNNTVSGFIQNGNSHAAAIEKTQQLVAQPGHSEHQTGLAIDFTTPGNFDQRLKMWDWLSQNAHHFGFILRYPENRQHITGFHHEPWHHRYVGREHAKIIFENNLTLEEYLSDK